MDPLFFELHSGLAHEAPGSRADTLRALALTGRSGPLRVLDAGSGPGAASLTLLDALPEAEVIALDLHAPFLADTQARADAAGLGARLRTHAGDMAEPPFAPASLDLIWSEGAAYSIGVPRALDAWKPLLAPGGRIAFSDAVWTDAAEREEPTRRQPRTPQSPFPPGPRFPGIELPRFPIPSTPPIADTFPRPRGERVDGDTLRKITDDTGGLTEIVRGPAGLPRATARIADELRRQYDLGYASTRDKDGKWHIIRVEVPRRGVIVRARTGYMAGA
jgi:SAM-dependent methyltransferase